MPIRYTTNGDVACAIFEGECAPEEADALLDWLRQTPTPRADLAACGGLHTALAQLLLAAGVQVTRPPADATLAACLGAGARAPDRADAGAPP